MFGPSRHNLSRAAFPEFNNNIYKYSKLQINYLYRIHTNSSMQIALEYNVIFNLLLGIF